MDSAGARCDHCGGLHRCPDFGIGHLLLYFADHGVSKEIERKELWVGLALTVGVLAVASFLATRPQGALGRLDKQTAIGRSPMSGELEMGSVPLTAKYGPEGSVADLTAGYTLYARNGAFADVIDVLKSVEDVGGIHRTLIYSRGLLGGQDELWIPIEGVRRLSRIPVCIPGHCRRRSGNLRLESPASTSHVWNAPGKRRSISGRSMSTRFDYIVVGVGRWLHRASRLSSQPDLRVALIEAGPDTPPDHTDAVIWIATRSWPISTLRHHWGDLRVFYGTAPDGDDVTPGDLPLRTGQGDGGGSPSRHDGEPWRSRRLR